MKKLIAAHCNNKTLRILFIFITSIFIMESKSFGNNDDVYLHNLQINQLKHQIWQIEERNLKKTDSKLEEELFDLRTELLVYINKELRNIENQTINKTPANKELINRFITLKKEYLAILNKNIEYLENDPSKTNTIESEHEIDTLKSMTENTLRLCINKNVKYSSFLFGHKDDDTYTCQKTIAKRTFHQKRSGLGSDAQISKTTDDTIVIHHWTNAFSEVSYTIKIWVND